MKIRKSALLNRWIEFEDGSRPGSTMLRFTESIGNQLEFQIRYVFDWDTGEVVNLGFTIFHSDFEKMIEKLEETGFGTMQRKEGQKEFLSEWRIVDDKLAVRIRGKSIANIQGISTYNMLEFAKLQLDENVFERKL